MRKGLLDGGRWTQQHRQESDKRQYEGPAVQAKHNQCEQQSNTTDPYAANNPRQCWPNKRDGFNRPVSIYDDPFFWPQCDGGE